MTSPADLPSRELDAAVAREVMGWTPDPECNGPFVAITEAGWQCQKCNACVRQEFPVHSERAPAYSTDMRAMLTVLDALRERGLFSAMYQGEKDWAVNVAHPLDGIDVWATHATLPRAVAEAALAAVGGK